MPVELDTGILAPACLALAGAFLAACGKVYSLGNEVKSLSRKVVELENKIKRTEDDRVHHLRAAADYYYNRIERNEKEIKEAKVVHGEYRNWVSDLVKELDRIQPGWSSRHGRLDPLESRMEEL